MLTTTSNPIQILLLEANPADVDLIVEYLSPAAADYDISIAKCLNEGLEKIGLQNFAVVLLDLSLPDSKGMATLKAIQESAPDAIIIILTGPEENTLSSEALQAGADDSLFKDRLNGDVLHRSIRGAIERAILTRKVESHAHKIEQREALLRSIFNANTDAMLVLTTKHEIKCLNPAAAALLEGDEASLVGEIFPFKIRDRQTSELEIPEANGSIRFVELSAVDLSWEGEGALLVILRDITKKRSLELELKREKHNSLSLLASGIAHDFNNMLTAILGNISVMRMGMSEEDENSKKLLAAETAAMQAKTLTQQLLTFSKGGVLALEVTTIDQVVEESARFILRGSNVKCEIEKEEPLWPVDADKGQISQVINNLIINADQAMPSGGTVTLRLRNRLLRHAEVPALKAGEYISLEVADQGVGISPKDMKRIFDPYFTTKDEGNGLGLASSDTIIRGHKGAMTVESKVGKGTCFSVYLPKSKKPVEAVPRTVKNPADPEPGKIHRGCGRILVMDDMEAMMMVAGDILNALGYEVAFTTNGEEAIEAYKQAKESGDPFDAVVFDLTVPGAMGGEEASEILINYDPNLIAIASSGYATSNIMSNHQNSAFKAVVPKPYRIKEMSDALHRVLQVKK